jgi:hypothetical protein
MTQIETNYESALSNANITISFGEPFTSSKGKSKGKQLIQLEGRMYPNSTETDKSYVQLKGIICPEDETPSTVMKPVGMFTQIE